MKITDILKPNCIRVPLRATEKLTVLEELVGLLHEQGQLTDRDLVLGAVRTREQTRSTGVGDGLAVPHGKSTGCSKLTLALGKPAKPLPFDSIDGNPCELVILLASPADSTGPHIQALGRISRIWRLPGFRSAVAQAQSSHELFEAIQRFQQ